MTSEEAAVATAAERTWHRDGEFMVCDIDDCGFAVEYGEGRAMAYHQDDAHGPGEV